MVTDLHITPGVSGYRLFFVTREHGLEVAREEVTDSELDWNTAVAAFKAANAARADLRAFFSAFQEI